MFQRRPSGASSTRYQRVVSTAEAKEKKSCQQNQCQSHDLVNVDVMGVRWQTSAATLGFILLVGVATLGNRFSKIHRFELFTSDNTNIVNETRLQDNMMALVVDNDRKDDNMWSAQLCVDAVNLLSRHIHDDQEMYGLRQWSLPLDNGIGYIDFPGLDDNLIRSSFEGRRIFFLGDSTTNNLYYWLYVLLKIHLEAPNNISSLSTMNLSDANSIIQSWHGCDVGRMTGAPPCDEKQSDNFPELDNLKYGSKRNVCLNDTDVFEILKAHKPEIIVANAGMWLLHFQAISKDMEGCVVKHWINYEHWLEYTVQIAEEVGARTLFFKTTNTICGQKYAGAYSKANKLYEMMDTETLIDCFNNIKFTQEINGLPTSVSLADEDIHNYCANATFNNHGSAHLNQRMYNFVESNRKSTSVELHILDDNIIKSCDYTEIGDARHYHPLNLVRIRLLAHLISCIE